MSKSILLYNGTVTLNFSEKARNRYTIAETGDSPVGVTTVLQKVLAKEALMTWPMWEAIKYLKSIKHTDNEWIITEQDFTDSSTAYTKKSDKGKDSGTLIHRAVQLYLEGHKQAVLPNVQKSLEAFEKWHKNQNIHTLGTEQLVYSKKYNYAGTFDHLGIDDGVVILDDLKTTNSSRTAPLGIYPEMFVQLGGYSLAYTEANPKAPAIQDLRIIRLPKPQETVNSKGEHIMSDDPIDINTIRASELGLSVRDCEEVWLQILGTYRFMVPLAKKLKELK